MSFWTGFYTIIIVAIVFLFVYSVIKMAMDHAEKVSRMRHGYPLKDGTRKSDVNTEVIDHRVNYGNNGFNK